MTLVSKTGSVANIEKRYFDKYNSTAAMQLCKTHTQFFTRICSFKRIILSFQSVWTTKNFI